MSRGPKHLCAAPNCQALIPMPLVMCAEHWWRVPAPLRAAVLGAYRPGQSRNPSAASPEYVAAVKAAIASLQPQEAQVGS